MILPNPSKTDSSILKEHFFCRIVETTINTATPETIDDIKKITGIKDVCHNTLARDNANSSPV